MHWMHCIDELYTCTGCTGCCDVIVAHCFGARLTLCPGWSDALGAAETCVGGRFLALVYDDLYRRCYSGIDALVRSRHLSTVKHLSYPMVLTGAREAQVMTEEHLKQLHEASGAWESNSSWTR